MHNNSVLKVSGVSKSFGWLKKVLVVDDVSFEICEGEVLAFLGPNGAGKTTTVKMASGLIIPDKGSVLIDGVDPAKNAKILKRVGTVLEGNRNLFWRLTAFENLMYFGVLQGQNICGLRKRVDDVLEKFNLLDKKNMQVRNYSRGMQQRLAIAKCWLHQPKLVILDEPTLGLDIYSKNELLKNIETLKNNGAGIIITTHNFEVAEKIADRVIILEKGRMVKMDTTSNLLKEFSGSKIVVELDGELSSDKIEELMREYNVEFSKNKLVFSEKYEKIYEIMPLIRPVKINSLHSDNKDLSEIFQQITGDKL